MNRYIYNDDFNKEQEAYIIHREPMHYVAVNEQDFDSNFVDQFEKTYKYNGRYMFGQHRLAKVEWVETVKMGDTVHGEMQFFVYKPKVNP